MENSHSLYKMIKHIDCPKEWISTNDYDSHRPLLYLTLKNDIECRPFAEFGSGYGSTDLLRKYCKEHGIKFQSWDTDKEWCKKTKSSYIRTFKHILLPTGYILFIDGKPGEERKDLLEMHKDKYILIAHDTEAGANYVYGMADVLSTFKYRLDYQPEGKPATTAVSNFVNVSEWI